MSTAPIAPAASPVPKPTPPVAYELAARRHMTDAEFLFSDSRLANAGQLYGFVAECGLKALLIACGISPDDQGGIPRKHPTKPKKLHPMHSHAPVLMGNINASFHLIPDGVQAARYMAIIPNHEKFDSWLIDHRYFRDSALPLTAVGGWRMAAREVTIMLDQAKLDGVL